MPRTRRDTAAAAKDDTVQVVANERTCTLYTHWVEDIEVLDEDTKGTSSQVGMLLRSWKCQQRQDGRRKHLGTLVVEGLWWTTGVYTA